MRTYQRRRIIQLAGAAAASVPFAATATDAVPSGLAPGGAFPDLVYQTEDGQTTTIAASRGKITLVYLWAEWCPICFNDIVSMQVIYNNLRGNPQLSPVVLNIMDDYRKGVRWARGRGITLPLGDSGMETRQTTLARTTTGTFLFPRATPQFYLLNRTGSVIAITKNESAGTQANQALIQDALSRTA